MHESRQRTKSSPPRIRRRPRDRIDEGWFGWSPRLGPFSRAVGWSLYLLAAIERAFIRPTRREGLRKRRR
ncbi:hypothetical protein [Amaricoccus solimangrovi]|uniref:Uncharacterized protein n=1 Tax=Amaricoccus solimangrovi TaxID=2589815 RepID=A0A501WP95_9RHOB|nr:hypothetical protein [Amaricoccus solimangrovi]TPE47566.1 hypothetical protein FJM51_19735 [Amaricoccus solimangrovi]